MEFGQKPEDWIRIRTAVSTGSWWEGSDRTPALPVQLYEHPDNDIYISIYIQSEVRMEDLSLHALEKTRRSRSIFRFSRFKQVEGKEKSAGSVEDQTSVPVEGTDDH